MPIFIVRWPVITRRISDRMLSNRRYRFFLAWWHRGGEEKFLAAVIALAAAIVLATYMFF